VSGAPHLAAGGADRNRARSLKPHSEKEKRFFMNRLLSRKREQPHAAYRDMLLDKRHSVLKSLGVKGDRLGRVDRVAEDDQAPISHEEFVSSRLNTLEYAHLRLVNEALDRIDSGDYGICLACEEPIAPKRLNALPWARYCVNCQESMATIGSGNESEAERPAFAW
jgi:DnaK suppressor protein